VDKGNVPAVIDTAPKGIPIEDIIHYKVKGLSHQEIADLIGCDKSNVTRRLKEANLEGLENFREYKDKALEHLQRKTVQNITDEEIKRLNPLQRITAAAILQDKIMVMRGQANVITENRNITVDLSKAYEAMKQSRGDADQNVDIPVDNTTYQPPDVPVR